MGKINVATVLGLLFALTATPSVAQSRLDEVLSSMGATTVREVKSDIALPADTAEYETMGKNGVLMLEASSALPSELPLRSAYVLANDIRVPLQRLAVLPAVEVTRRLGTRDETYTRQVSFYLIPIYLLTKDAKLMVDFQGRREAFGVITFPLVLTDAPTFIRADDYSFPSEPDLEAAAALTIREFPSSFGSAQ